MIEKIKKLNLAAVYADRDGILDVLQRTNAVEIKEHSEIAGYSPLPVGGEEIQSYLNSLEAALEILVSAAENSADKDKIKGIKDGFCVSYEEFMGSDGLKEKVDGLVAEVNGLADRKFAAIAEQSRLSRALSAAEPYGGLTVPFDSFRDGLHTRVVLGTLSSAAWDGLRAELDKNELCAYSFDRGEDTVLICLVAHRSVFAEAETALSGAGFARCPYSGAQTGADMVSDLKSRLDAAREEQLESERNLCALSENVRMLKIYCDRVAFEYEKAQSSAMMRGGDRVFFLEAFVPAERESDVKNALDGTGAAMWYEFSEPAEDEEIPTLLKNNPVVANFEAITNMYSPPNAREFDPNTVMAFFYSLFLGFIMADIGYGLLMFFGGGALWLKSRKGSGLKSLSGVFAVGGIFTLVWGFMFNSFFGIALLPVTVMPDARSDMYTFVGIKIPSVLIIAMLLGILQLFAGYVCHAVQDWRKGNVLDGLFDGVTWALFSVGVVVAILGLVEEFALPSVLVTVGGITAGVSLVAAALTAGRKEKFIGKFTKGFGSLYGIINYVSDILSYARLYGLMLSGAIIAQIVSQYSIQFATSGNVLLIALGVALMIIGHTFNLAIGLLGAYIHDARLQYVEFYGRFYQGEGELFSPLGSKHRHIYLEQNPTK